MSRDAWLQPALDYLPRWLEHQLRQTEQPGCALTIVHRGRVVLETALGHADRRRGAALSTRHVFRVASHSKTFTAAGILLLRDRGRLGLDDAVGRHVDGLHAEVAATTLAQLLSHTAGLVRDGTDGSQWMGRRPFLSAAELRADLGVAPTLPASTRFKYSNHGYALLGLVIEAVTGEAYGPWITREVVRASGLETTWPDMPEGGLPRAHPLAAGHTLKWPLGERLPVAGGQGTRAMAPATGFVSHGADLLRFYRSLAPQSTGSVLSVASRREMTRRLWQEEHSVLARWYGLGTISATTAGFDFFGHSGSFPGTLSRTVHVPAQDLGVSIITNAADGPCHPWLDGVLHVLALCRKHGAPSAATKPWTGRWWVPGGVVDLLPLADRVIVAGPALANPVQDATQFSVQPRTRGGERHGQVTLSGGFGVHGEPVRLVHDAAGRPKALWLGGFCHVPEAQIARELRRRHGAASPNPHRNQTVP